MIRSALLAGALTLAALPPPAAAQGQGPGLAVPAAGKSVFLVEAVAERTVDRLPVGPLYWRVESFPTLSAARVAAGPFGLAAEAWGEAWLLTLGPPGGATLGGRKMAEVGPVPVAPASRYMLRINRAGGPPGSSTPVHTHPGSEAFYVIRGQLSQRTPHGVAKVEAGKTLNGHGPGMAMQLTSSGSANLEQLVMFVVDAQKPFSSPARLD